MGKIKFSVFVVSLATLMHEILLTRIFSVTMWYHYAFMAISIAMFGLTFGATLVYLFPNYFGKEKARARLSLFSLLFSILVPVSFFIYLLIPVNPTLGFETIKQIYILGTAYLVIATPFVLSGIVICLVLTKFSEDISKLYAADLVGAAIGCIALLEILNFTTGPTAVIFIGSIASIAGLIFAEKTQKSVPVLSLLVFIFLFGLGLWNNHQASLGKAIFSLKYVKGDEEKGTLYEKWNSFSRITVWGNAGENVRPFGWGLSDTLPSQNFVNQLWLFIDSVAGTPLTKFSGDLYQIEFLKYDIVNLAHHLQNQARVFVVGVGGGRDILSALAFKQKEVTGVEVNNAIVGAITDSGKYADFTGHLERYPNVKIVNEEARSYIERSTDKYDIIQISLIDTWAATAAGAFVLTENSLYTVEAWNSFISHLSDNGILTVSRWYFRDRPGEMYRLTSLAAESLRQNGIQNPRDHILIARKMTVEPDVQGPDGVGTMLVSKEAFTPTQIKAFNDLLKHYQFESVLTPYSALDDTFSILAVSKTPEKFLATYPINISPPLDDNPFFFHMLRLKDFANPANWSLGKTSFNMKAVATLLLLLIITIFFALVFIILPLSFSVGRIREQKGSASLLIYFCSIGLGFMLVEISLLQRLIIYLGHPVYGLSVILFSLLLAGGVGSYFTKSIGSTYFLTKGLQALIGLLIVVGGVGIFIPYMIHMSSTTSISLKIIFSVLTIGSMGIAMGMAFPIGMKLASRLSPELTPFLWGANGAMSVVGSVLGVVIAITFGISISLIVGIFFYIIALLSFITCFKQNYNHG